MATDSLGEYKVVVTADYSQLKSQFDAMSNFVNSTTKVMADNLNKTMGGINATMITQLKATVDQLKKSFDGLDTTTKKSGDGFKTYAQQIKEAEKAAQKCHQEIGALQEKMATSSMSQTDLARLDQLKAKFRELREHADNLKSAQADYNMRIKETQNLEAMAAKAKKQADQEALKQLQQQAKEQAEAVKQANNRIRSASGFGDYAKRIREEEKATEQFYKQQGQAILAAEERAIAGRTAAHKSAMEEIFRQEDAIARKKQTEHNKQQQHIRNLQTQYNVTYGEINKYMQAHAKMSEAVFIRLQGKISAIADEMRELNTMPVMANPLAGMDYNKYTSQFSKWNDFFVSFKHHMTWMASAMAIGTAFAIPAKTISTIAEVERQMAQMKQVNEAVKDSQEVLNKTTQDYIGIAQQYGASVNEVIKAGVLWGRAYKDLNTVMKLTTLSTKLAVADNMDIDLANRAVESVINGYQKQGQAIQFATHVVDSWTKVAHNAQSSATDLAEALSRTGAAAKAVGVDFDTTTALASTMIKATGRSGAEVGRPKLAA